MEDKTVKKLLVATVAFLGVSYILEKHIRDKKRQQEIENSKIEDEETGIDEPRHYILLNEVYEDALKQNFNEETTAKSRK